MRIELTICRFHLQFRTPRYFKFTKQIYLYLFMDSTSCSSFRKTFWGFRKFCCRLHKIVCFCRSFAQYSVSAIDSNEDQRKVAMLRIPQKIWFGTAAESAYNSQNAQFGLVTKTTKNQPEYKVSPHFQWPEQKLYIKNKMRVRKFLIEFSWWDVWYVK